MKVDDPQLSWVPLVIHCFLRVNLLFRKFVGCGGPKLTGVRLGGVSFEEPLVQGKKKKKKGKGNTGITIPPWRFLVSNSLFFLSAYSTVTLYSHFKF